MNREGRPLAPLAQVSVKASSSPSPRPPRDRHIAPIRPPPSFALSPSLLPPSSCRFYLSGRENERLGWSGITTFVTRDRQLEWGAKEEAIVLRQSVAETGREAHGAEGREGGRRHNYARARASPFKLSLAPPLVLTWNKNNIGFDSDSDPSARRSGRPSWLFREGERERRGAGSWREKSEVESEISVVRSVVGSRRVGRSSNDRKWR